MTCQPFKFALDATDEQVGALFSHFGARRYAYNWTVEQLRRHRFCYAAHKRRSESVPEIASGPAGHAYDWRAMRAAPAYPDRRDLRKQWNVEKHQRCVNSETGEVWWTQNSKEAYANGIFDACDAFDKWARSCAEGGKVGFPKFKKRGSDCDRYRISTGALRLDDRRHVVIPRVGGPHPREHAQTGPPHGEGTRTRQDPLSDHPTPRHPHRDRVRRRRRPTAIHEPGGRPCLGGGYRCRGAPPRYSRRHRRQHPRPPPQPPRPGLCARRDTRRGSPPVALRGRFAPLPRTQQRTRGAARPRPKHPIQLPAPHHHRSCQEPRHDSGRGCGVVGSGPAEAPARSAHAPTAIA